MIFFHKIDIVHSVNNVLPLLGKTKKIATVHDIAYAKFPSKRFRGFKKLFYEYFVPRSVKAASRLIVPSVSTADDVCRSFNVNKKDVNIINESHDAIFWPSSEIDKEEARKKFNINGDYILFVGNVEPIKNLNLVIEALDSINKKDISLVIAGNLDWAFDELKNNIERRKLASKVIFTGFVSDLELRHLYSGARAFILASLYEGFGLPILEAMACGIPVISSNSSSLPEVAGDAAILFDPTNIDELIKAMKNVLENNSLREELISKGHNQVKNFSWEKCAKETLKVYEEVYGS